MPSPSDPTGDMNSEEFRGARNAIIAERVGHDADCGMPNGDGPCICYCTCTQYGCEQDGESEPSFGEMVVTSVWIDHTAACRCVPCGRAS